MNPRNTNPLLKEILADDNFNAVRRASLDQGLRVMRRARQIRRLARVGTFALLGLLLATMLMVYWPASKSGTRDTRNVMPANVVSTPPREATVKRISDEELFALFPGRSLALIGKPGHQQLVFLDNPPRQNEMRSGR